MGGGRTGGRERLPLVAGLALLCWLVSAAPALAVTFEVNNTNDVADPNLGDGLCDVDPGPGTQCTLRAAVQQANALPSTAQDPHVINLPAQTFTLTIPGRDELGGATGDLNLTAAGIRIVGQGATQTIVQAGTAPGNGVDRVFRVHPTTSALMERLTIQHGVAGQSGAPRSGGGVLNEGTLTVDEVELRLNRANNDGSQSGGGGIANATGATLTVTQSAVIENVAFRNGGGIANQGTATLDTVTIAGNDGGGAVGGVFIFNAPSTVIRSSTIVGNQAPEPTGGGLGAFPGSPPFRIANTILDNPNGRNCSNTTALTSEGFNIVSDFSCPLPTGGTSTDRITSVTRLGSLDLHGGQTRTIVPQRDSPALDGGASTATCGGGSAVDQRGLTRPQDGLLEGALLPRCDIGAVEVPSLRVTSTIDALPAGGTPSAACRNATNQCSLRQAILDSNALGGAALSLPTGTYTLTRTGRNEDAALTGDLDVTAPLLIRALLSQEQRPADTVIRAGTSFTNGIDRVFHVHVGAELILRDLTLQFGHAQASGLAGGPLAGEGGAVLAVADLRLERVVVRQSRADTNGGGISARSLRLLVTDTEIRDNTAGTAGGGIASRAASIISGSTFAFNAVTDSANGTGGGLSLTIATNDASQLRLSTFSGNQAATSAAIDANVGNTGFQINRVSVVDNPNTTASGAAVRLVRTSQSGQISVSQSLFAKNSAPNCTVSGTIDGNDNLSDDGTCAIGSRTRLNLDPVLGQLRDNGGLTRTHALLPGSPAIDAISPLECFDEDQRGDNATFVFTGRADGDDRPGADCDVGAFEVQRLVVGTTLDATDPRPGDGDCGRGDRECSVRAAVQEANAEGHAVVEVPTGTYTLTLRGSGEDAAATGDLDVTGALTLLGAAANTTIIQAGSARTNGIDRVFEIRPGAIARLQSVTLKQGRVEGGGAGVLNHGILALTDVEVVDGTALGSGGNGGGIASVTGSSTTLRRVTVATNLAQRNGGGILADGEMTLENVTISANEAADRGGGIWTDAILTLNNVTVSFNNHDNQALPAGDGMFLNSGTTTGSNTIFSHNGRRPFPGAFAIVEPDSCGSSGNASVISRGFNYQRVPTLEGPAFPCFLGALGDVAASEFHLDNLALNDGQTRSHRVINVQRSNPIDGGNPATPLDGRNGRCAATDQRNLPRPVDSNGDGLVRCDAGAFEGQPSEDSSERAGTFSVQASTQQARPGQPVVLTFGWTVPAPRVWRDLDRLDLRLLAANGQPVFILRWTEAGDRYILLDANGRELAAGTPGSATVLTMPLVSLALRDVKTQGSGPTGQAVTLTLPFIFTQAADDQVFTIQVAGRADSGAEDSFATAATIQVGDPGPQAPPTPPSDDEKDEKPERPRKETEEERQQRERGNAAGQDEYRTEGNVVEAHLDARPPYVIIATRDGPVRLNLRGDAARVTVKVGDYVTAGGEKIHEQLYEVDDLDVE